MSETPKPPEGEGEKPQSPPGGEKPKPERPAVDLRKLPSGEIPEAWKNLPPPKIERAEPEPPPTAKSRFQEFMHTRAFRQIAMILGALVLVAVLILFFRPKVTLNSHYGTLRIFCDALVERDLDGMQRATSGIASDMCSGLLMQIAGMESGGDASRLAAANYVVGGANQSERVPAYVICEGESGDDFLQINMVLEQQDDGTWRITEMGTESL